MATLDELTVALRNADAAGDTNAARILAAQIGSMQKPDKYQQAAIEERDTLKAKGVDTGAGYSRRYAQGATMGTADEILAGLTTPLEMIRQGTLDPREGYKYAKAREDLILKDSRDQTGALGSALEIGGGVGTGVNAARAGLSFGRNLAPNAGLGSRSLASAGDAAAFGGIAGAAEGNSLEERGKNALQGTLLGGAVGGATPGALQVAGALIKPVTSNIAAVVNPERYGRTQVARGMNESGLTPQQVADAVAAASREGQGMFTVADALGNSGQRMLSTVARSPGQARTDVVEFLENRQGGQGRRIANALSEGFNAPVTAQRARTAMTEARDTAADAAYGAARTNANPVDVTGVIANIDNTLSPGVNQIARPQSGIANDSIEAALESVRRRLTDNRSNLTDFTAIQRVRDDLSDMIQAAQRQGHGNRARMLGGILRELDTAMENASQGFRQANRDFSQASRAIDAVDEGSQAALRGRSEDVIPAFQGMTAPQQVGYRVGYADPLIAQTQGAAFGANKARPLMNDAFVDEAAAIAPGNPLMQRRIGRENTMFQTRNAATGNSKTVENLNDDAAMSVDPSLIGNVLSGNWGGVARGALQAGQNALTGNTPAVRQEVGRILTMRGGNVTPQQLQQILDEAVQRIRTRQLIASQLGRGASAGVAVTPGATGQRRR